MCCISVMVISISNLSATDPVLSAMGKASTNLLNKHVSIMILFPLLLSVRLMIRSMPTMSHGPVVVRDDTFQFISYHAYLTFIDLKAETFNKL